ncbi:outer membrane beta-barrel protein [Pontibacter lucknowensis]|uniref:Outer membrane protein beta-barrel domain-containing protein n=1 Tax=Pontibacter lucknowensis TaxID=1077936 RepID=A0A1N6WRV4_9BACT|nr:outer membrane beta-barrel protein [Pontibacter lucknowensis]SIQ92752.1 Outer membrane protein beta-barrel domain-containing protein [Pontibacter lucknowensis]
MKKFLGTFMVPFLLLLCNQVQGQHTHQLEVKIGGGLAATAESHSFDSKGFTITQKAEREGYFFSASVGTNKLLKVVETSYSLRYLTFDDTQLQYTSPGADITSPLQQLSAIQHYVGATYYPFTNYNSRFSPFVYAGLGYNVLQFSQEKGDVIASTPAKGDVLPTVVTWNLPAAKSTLGALGYEAAIGLKYLDSEKFGVFVQLRYNQIHQSKTDRLADKLNMLQVEGGFIWRTLKQKRAF